MCIIDNDRGDKIDFIKQFSNNSVNNVVCFYQMIRLYEESIVYDINDVLFFLKNRNIVDKDFDFIGDLRIKI